MLLKDRILDNIRKSGLKRELTSQWEQAIEKGYLELTEPDSVARPIFVGLQAVIEDSIAQAIKDGDVKSAVNIVHTPKPVNPYAQEVSDTRPYEGIDDFYDDLEDGPDAKGFVRVRRKILDAFMQVGGVVVSVYPNDAEVPEVYLDNVAQARRLDHGLTDHPVEGVDPALTGATLVAEDQDGITTVFSLNAYQMQTAGDGQDKTWRVWFGQPEEGNDLQTRLADVRLNVETPDASLDRWADDSQQRIEFNAD